jgi:hypothetical protein
VGDEGKPPLMEVFFIIENSDHQESLMISRNGKNGKAVIINILLVLIGQPLSFKIELMRV